MSQRRPLRKSSVWRYCCSMLSCQRGHLNNRRRDTGRIQIKPGTVLRMISRLSFPVDACFLSVRGGKSLFLSCSIP